jgi:hypothetical protein
MPRAPLLVIALALLGALEARGQAAQPASPGGEKSATAARIIGIIPGAGHMYAGETGRGFAYMGGTLGILLVGSVAVAADCVAEGITGSECKPDPMLDVVTVATLGLWAWSIYDAGNAAHRRNAKLRQSRVSFIIAPGSGSQRSSRQSLKLGVALTISSRPMQR